MQTQIVETVTAVDTASLRRRRDAVAGADIVELRLDYVRDLDVAGALRDRTRPVVVTCRPTWEGGEFDGAEEARRRVLEEAVALGAEFVDVERRAEWRPDLAGSKTALVLSDHEFTSVPDDLDARVDAMRRERPGIVKISAMTQSATDCLRLRDAANGQPGTVMIGMGPFGRISRALPAHFGSCWTYAGNAAPGQYSTEELIQQFRVRDIGPATQLFAVTGQPLEHSASPVMHNAAFKALGIDAVYVPLQAGSVADAMTVADELRVRGLSVTSPLKRGWPVTLDDAASRELGAVNTLKREAGAWLGRNVDGDGFLDAFDARGIVLSGKRVVILGAGGAARAVGRALIGRGSTVAFSARRHDEAVRLAEALGADVATWPPKGRWDVLVNSTPVGTWPDVTARPFIDPAVQSGIVYDLVYNPEETALQRDARATGAVTIGGLEMLVGQAVRQSEWWTGRTPPPALMTEAARAWIASNVSLKVSDDTDIV
ncbi:MAG: type I 3-dehydroquinate dehydratase [Vicinamibacterales bacterium]